MHHYHAHHQHSMCTPWAQYFYYHPGYFWPEKYTQGGYYPYCPLCCQPIDLCCCSAKAPISIPQEVSVDTATSPKEALIGGLSDVKLTLEYMPEEGASAPSVKVTITGSDGISTWEETSIPAGYHVKSDFSTVSPGSKVTIEVTEAIARLRWCETICC